MKKTTAHGRKLKRMGAGFNGVEWINAISRCQPYTDELIPGAIGSLPHRQLRKAPPASARSCSGSLPHRQLRKPKRIFFYRSFSSLPHRQLRKNPRG